jgi:hypothetical protein
VTGDEHFRDLVGEAIMMMRELFQQGTIDLDAPSLLTFEVASALRFHPKQDFFS